MRNGRRTKSLDYGEGSAKAPGNDARMVSRQPRFGSLADGLREVGFTEEEVAGILGNNWAWFFAESFYKNGRRHQEANRATSSSKVLSLFRTGDAPYTNGL